MQLHFSLLVTQVDSMKNWRGGVEKYEITFLTWALTNIIRNPGTMRQQTHQNPLDHSGSTLMMEAQQDSETLLYNSALMQLIAHDWTPWDREFSGCSQPVDCKLMLRVVLHTACSGASVYGVNRRTAFRRGDTGSRLGICGEQCGTGAGSSPSHSVFPCLYYSTVAHYSHIYINMSYINGPVSGTVP